jgi:hypothetical protein
MDGKDLPSTGKPAGERDGGVFFKKEESPIMVNG